MTRLAGLDTFSESLVNDFMYTIITLSIHTHILNLFLEVKTRHLIIKNFVTLITFTSQKFNTRNISKLSLYFINCTIIHNYTLINYKFQHCIYKHYLFKIRTIPVKI